MTATQVMNMPGFRPALGIVDVFGHDRQRSPTDNQLAAICRNYPIFQHFTKLSARAILTPLV
jgi:hypothetical protein